MTRSKALTKENVLSHYNDGLSSFSIARKLKSSIGEVRKILHEIGLEENKYIRQYKNYDHLIQPVKCLYQNGIPKKRIAKQLRTHFQVVFNIIKQQGFVYEKPSVYGKKKCAKCKEFLEYSKFGKSNQSKDGLKTVCKACRKIHEPSRKEYLREWASRNKQKKSDLDREYRIKNYLKIKAQRKTAAYKEIKKRSDKKFYEKAMSDPNKKLIVRLRIMLSSFKKYKKSNTFTYLGYTSTDLANHLQSKFKEGMSWDNHGRGGWHIDHIKPIAAFDLSEDDWLKKAFSLDNLQPLFESENCSKGSLYNGKRHTFVKSTLK